MVLKDLTGDGFIGKYKYNKKTRVITASDILTYLSVGILTIAMVWILLLAFGYQPAWNLIDNIIAGKA